jgi:hypothetical protein
MFQSTLTSDQMVDFIIDNNLEDWSGLLDYHGAKEIANLSDEWKLTNLPLNIFDWVSDSSYENKSSKLPPIVLFDGEQYDVLDGKHRIGMAKDSGKEQIKVYLGKLI